MYLQSGKDPQFHSKKRRSMIVFCKNITIIIVRQDKVSGACIQR